MADLSKFWKLYRVQRAKAFRKKTKTFATFRSITFAWIHLLAEFVG